MIQYSRPDPNCTMVKEVLSLRMMIYRPTEEFMGLRLFSLTAVLMCLVAMFQTAPAMAAIVLVNNEDILADNQAFRAQVYQCFELFSSADSETKEIINALSKPRPAPVHTIQPGNLDSEIRSGEWDTDDPAFDSNNLEDSGDSEDPVDLGHAAPDNSDQSKYQSNGSQGKGSGSTITLDYWLAFWALPANEFCAVLLHELKHALDFNNGADKQTSPPRPQPGAGIPDAEIDAMREENRFRKHIGLPQVLEYNGIPLPSSAIFK